MADERDHILLANRNHATLVYLLKEASAHPEWIATVTFYKAVHIVEAVFATEMSCHSFSHDDRLRRLKLPRFHGLGISIRPLYAASLVARYLVDFSAKKLGESGKVATYRSFADYMTADEVVERLVYKRLNVLEQHAVQFISTEGRTELTRTQVLVS